MTKIVGLTGGIATGKSTVAAYMESQGIVRFDADACVHRLLSEDNATIEVITQMFKGVVIDGVVNRKALGAIVFHDDAAMKALENRLHPMVRAQEDAMIARAKKEGAAVVLLDIPLLFETDAHERCDVTMTTDCSVDTQRARALNREGMTHETFNAIVARQMPGEIRKSRADYVINTDCSWSDTQQQIDQIIKEISS